MTTATVMSQGIFYYTGRRLSYVANWAHFLVVVHYIFAAHQWFLILPFEIMAASKQYN
jgi:hypothetical protein